MIFIKIGILTRNIISKSNVSITGIPNTYMEIIKKEAYPVIIDSSLFLKRHKKDIVNQIKDISGFIIPGGDTISEVDLFIIDYCYKNDIPLLGICLGMQELGAYFNNNVIAKLNDLSHFDMEAKYLHEIILSKSGYLYNLLKVEKMDVNSRHKYYLIENENYSIEAIHDNIIEAIKVCDKKYMLGVQFHPEIMYEYDKNAQLILKDFFTECKRYSSL